MRKLVLIPVIIFAIIMVFMAGCEKKTEKNKAIVRRLYEEVINKRNMAVVDELIATNYIDHDKNPELVARDPKSFRQVVTMLLTAFPDMRVTVEDQVAEGDKVASRFTMRGTHKGEFMGIAPTGNDVAFGDLVIMRVEEGKIVELWAQLDYLWMFQQLGMELKPKAGEK